MAERSEAPLKRDPGAVARAIMAERKRCADIADKWDRPGQNSFHREAARLIRNEILYGSGANP